MAPRAPGRKIIVTEPTPEAIPTAVSPTSNPQVAKFTATIPPKSTIAVEFGLDTSYGFWTSRVAAPAGGGAVSILVAGMKAASLSHMRAKVGLESGWCATRAGPDVHTRPL